MLKKKIINGSKKFFKIYEKKILNLILDKLNYERAFNKKINTNNFFFKLIYGKNNLDIELITRQIILSRFVNVEIISKYVFLGYNFSNSCILSLPFNHLEIIKQYININKLFSVIFFYLCVFLNLFKSIFIFLKISLSFSKKMKNNSILLFGFPESSTTINKNYFNFLNWIRHHYGQDISIFYTVNKKKQIISSNNKINSKHYNDIFIRISLKKYLYFILWFISALIYSIICFLFFRWWHLFLLPETVKSKYLSLVDLNHFPKKLFFTLGNLIYRPMWSYILEKKGVDIQFVNYGPSISGVNINNEIIHYPGFITQTWNNRLEYCEPYVNYLKKKLLFNFNYTLFREIYWLDSTYSSIHTQKKIITVFDSTPFDKYEQLKRLYFNILGDEDFSIKFLEDIIEISKEIDFHLIIKTKKTNFEDRVSVKYKEYLNNIRDYKNISIIKGIAPKSLLDISNSIISFPFTSTAVIAQNNEKRVCFYKPTNIEYQDKLQSLGIEINYNKTQLKKWIINSSI